MKVESRRLRKKLMTVEFGALDWGIASLKDLSLSVTNITTHKHNNSEFPNQSLYTKGSLYVCCIEFPQENHRLAN